MPTTMLQSSELDSPTQDALNLLNSMPPSNSNSEWNLFLQDSNNSSINQSNLQPPQPDKESNFNSYQYNSLTLGIPDPSWPNIGIPSGYTYYTTPPSHYVVEQELRKQSELMQPIHLESEQLMPLPDNFQEFSQMSPRVNKDCRSYNCLQYASYPQDYYTGYPSMANIHSDDSIKHSLGPQLFSEVDSRYDLPKLPDFSPDLSNMINMNLSESVNNELLKVVDSDDEESDIIVEESDTESEISISDVGPYLSVQIESDGKNKLSCVVCSMSYKDSSTVNFIQLNNTFPLTFATKTPVLVKLIEIIPLDMQNFVKFENTLICQRCLNLIDTAENLEFKLINVKQELCNFLSKTMMLTSPLILPLPGVSPQNKPLASCEFSSTQEEIQIQPKEEPLFTEVNNSKEEHSKKVNSLKDTKNEPVAPTDTKKSEDKENLTTLDKVEVNKKKDGREGRRCYQCDRCGRTYIKKSRFNDHLAKHLGLYKLKCQYCNKGFMKESNLQIHLRTHTKERKYQCQNCPASFVDEVEFASHICSEKRFMCDLCPKLFTNKLKLEFHCKVIHKRKKNICKVCSKEFKYPSALEKHLRSHDNERKFVCHQCDRGFKSVSHLNSHIKTNHLGRKHECTKCDKIFPSHKELKEHNLVVHGICDKFKCKECNKIFAEKKYLRIHEKIHLGTAKINTCPICFKTFKYTLKTHLLIHSAEKKFHCEECDIHFTLKSGLSKHNKLKHLKEQKVEQK